MLSIDTNDHIHPVVFDILESTVDFPPKHVVAIGNSGSEYHYTDSTQIFFQHFMPDGAYYQPSLEKLRIKYTTIYAAALFYFLSWHNELPTTHIAKKITKINGTTNEIMANMRQKLLGSAITTYRSNIRNGAFDYEIKMQNISHELMNKLSDYANRARREAYQTNLKFET